MNKPSWVCLLSCSLWCVNPVLSCLCPAGRHHCRPGRWYGDHPRVRPHLPATWTSPSTDPDHAVHGKSWERCPAPWGSRAAGHRSCFLRRRHWSDSMDLGSRNWVWINKRFDLSSELYSTLDTWKKKTQKKTEPKTSSHQKINIYEYIHIYVCIERHIYICIGLIRWTDL